MEEREEPRMLNYVTPETTRREFSRGQLVGGAVLSVAVVGLTVPAGLLFGYALNEFHGAVVGWLLIGAVVVGLHLAAVFARRNPRRQALAQGLWLGLGIAVLLEGLCFLAISR